MYHIVAQVIAPVQYEYKKGMQPSLWVQRTEYHAISNIESLLSVFIRSKSNIMVLSVFMLGF